MKVTMVPATAWSHVARLHRCSAPYCYTPAVAFTIDHVDGGWRGRRGFDRRRYVCADHLAAYRIVERRGRYWYVLVEPERVELLRRRRERHARTTPTDSMGAAQG